MANYIGQIEKAYNAIYDYLMNKCENRDFYHACIKSDIKNLSKSSIYYDTNDLFDVMLSLKETIQQNAAKESGNGGLRKAMLNVLKRGKGRYQMLEKAYVEDGYTMVCDSYTFIRTKRNVDIPTHESDVKWMNWRGLIPNLEEREEFPSPSVSELKQHIKLNAKNPRYLAENWTPFYEIVRDGSGELIARVNAKYLLDALEAMNGTDYKFYAKDSITPIFMQNSDGECALVCPIRV